MTVGAVKKMFDLYRFDIDKYGRKCKQKSKIQQTISFDRIEWRGGGERRDIQVGFFQTSEEIQNKSVSGMSEKKFVRFSFCLKKCPKKIETTNVRFNFVKLSTKFNWRIRFFFSIGFNVENFFV